MGVGGDFRVDLKGERKRLATGAAGNARLGAMLNRLEKVHELQAERLGMRQVEFTQ